MKKRFKIFMVGIGGLLLLFTAIGLLIPSSVKISRGVIVQADSAFAAQTISDVKTWPLWMSWMRSDQGTMVTFIEEGNTKGVKWVTLSKAQSGSMIIQKIENGEVILRHKFPEMNQAEGRIRVRSAGAGQSEILWMLEYPLRWYPWERFEGIFMDTMIGAALEKALNDLNKYLERRDA